MNRPMTRSCIWVDFEKQIVLRVLERVRWNQSEAARILGLHRNSLKIKLERWKIKAPRET